MPMPTPEYEEHLNYMRRAGRRADGEKQTPDRSHAARDASGVRPDLSDSRLLGLQGKTRRARVERIIALILSHYRVPGITE